MLRRLFAASFLLFAAAPARAGEIDFNRDVRPILNKNCTACHGGVKQAGDVSFIRRQQALGKGESGLPTVVPGRPADSEMIRRLRLPLGDSDHMPPAEKHPDPLSSEEIDTLTRWIAEGAEWGEHWAFVKPEPQTIPAIQNAGWPQTRLDRFVLARIEAAGRKTAAEASPAEWLRRVSFGLTGLPPSDEMVAQVKTDCSEPARKRIVDSLLDSPSFGERWAAVWMDVARYADSKGYEKDQLRTMWPYRDWLIRAFDGDMPYSDFLVRQLAGDRLPDATLDDSIATGFFRSSQSNTEGGTDDEEFRIAALIDRVNTTWTAFQGVTFGCIQCHSHPYDPFPQPEYYQFAAFFNNLADCDLNNDFPTLQVPDDRAQFDRALKLQRERREIADAAADRLAQVRDRTSWAPLKIEHRWTNKSQVQLEEIQHQGQPVQVTRGTPTQKSIYELVGAPAGGVVEAIQVQSLMQPGTSRHTPSPAAVVTQFELRLRRAGNHEPEKPFEKIAIREVLGDDANGLIQSPQWGAFPNQFQDRWVVLAPAEPIRLGPDERLSVVLHQDYGRDGAEPPVLRRFAVSTTADPAIREETGSETFQKLAQQQKHLDAEIGKLGGTATPVALERDFAPRQTAVFSRGNFLDKTDVVQPAIPAVFTGPAETMDRLAMARWMASPENPLTARVWVNRVWAEMFGIGLVETLEDFGSTGAEPSHPALLDDLAVRFQGEMGWRLKSLLREIVLSATYRQTAAATPEGIAADPRNRLLARGPRNRLTAEMVRDHALATAGLLSAKRFGPSVMPPQPEGLWNSPYSNDKWTEAKGEDRHRRGLYTFWRRGTPYPSFETFDAPERRVCSARRIATNTPLQALVTLNDPVYLEAAEAFATRMRNHAPDNFDEQLRHGYRLATTREAPESDLAILRELHRDLAKDHPADAKAALAVIANALLNLDSALTW